MQAKKRVQLQLRPKVVEFRTFNRSFDRITECGTEALTYSHR